MKASLHRVAALSEIAPGKLRCVSCNGRRIMLANVAGTIYAADDACTHEDASLSKGVLHGEYVKCPLHNSRFNVRTGQVMEEPAEDDLRTYPVKIEGGEVYVEIE